MIDRNHPAIEEAAIAYFEAQRYDWGIPDSEAWEDLHEIQRDNIRREAHGILTAALPHLTADDLRNTEAGRALMAEAWQEGAMAHAGATNHLTPGTRHIINEMMRAANPYR